MLLQADKSTEISKLLQQLGLDSKEREDHPGPWRSRWLPAANPLIGALAAGVAASFVLCDQCFEIGAATAIGPSAATVPTAILEATGYVTARRQATVSAQVTSTLREVLINEDEHVQTRQLLARLENGTQQAALAQAQAQLRAAQALGGQYDAQLAQARRAEDLVASPLGSDQALEDARTQVETLKAQVEFQRKHVEIAHATMRGAEVELNYRVVRAPFSGVIIASSAQVGEIASPDSAGGGFIRTDMGTIVDIDSLEIEVVSARRTSTASSRINLRKRHSMPCLTGRSTPAADRRKSTVKARIAVELNHPRFLPNMGVRVSFLEAAKNRDIRSPNLGRVPPRKGVLVPRSAIVERDGMSVVFNVHADRAHEEAVSPGQRYAELRLFEGIANHTTAVRTPPAELNVGARIVIKKR